MEGQRAANERAGVDWLALALLLAATLLSLGAMVLFDRAEIHGSVYDLSNLVGPTAKSLAAGDGLVVCTEAMGTPGNPICFHGARMPMASAVVAGGAAMLGDHLLRVAALKVLLLLLPLVAAMLVVWRRLPARGMRRWAGAGLLLLPFLTTTFLADVVNMQVEEGYSYSLLALALALVLFREGERRPWLRAAVFGLAAAGLYLAKSAMAPAVAVLTLAYLWPRRREGARVALVLGLVLLAPVGWALWQHHAAGRYTLGTSLDGVNLHKGNDEIFLAHYPPSGSETLDMYDALLSQGHHFGDEWSFNDYHQRAAVLFAKGHPAATATALWRKAEVILFSVHKLGSQPRHGVMEAIETGGILLFRLLFWTALGLSLWWIVTGQRDDMRYAAGSFLLVTAAVALPYLAGFAYTRHISVLLYPSALLLCRALTVESPWKQLQP